ncbi:MAG: hypothetical protein KatS3mg001_456 [Candidatus Pacearchaeota archaeon]|nr:MAG: hypothetical protein KatS3mg001_456 [Candidatus Pacearchaeota archaeon]
MKKRIALTLLGILYFGAPSKTLEETINFGVESSLEEIIETIENLPNKEIKKYKKIYEILEEEYKKLDNFPPYFDLDILSRLIYAESRYNEKAVSRNNAKGLMQLKRSAWYQVEKNLDYDENVFNPRMNIRVGLKYILWIDEYCRKKHQEWDSLEDKEKRKIVLAAYNAGAFRVFSRNWDISKMPKETREYIKYFDE